MMSLHDQLTAQGYAIHENCYTSVEVKAITQLIDKKEVNLSDTPVFAIRALVEKIPELEQVIFNTNFLQLLSSLDLDGYFLTKSIYFDKPENSNWYVNYHQDISISVKEKHDIVGYSMWTKKKGIVGVVPPVDILDKTVTLRIHLDDTDEGNGALKVLPSSHLNGILRIEEIEKIVEHICKVSEGGVMLMKPLLFHSSKKSTENKRRRVIHLEFCNQELAAPIEWAEKLEFNK